VTDPLDVSEQSFYGIWDKDDGTTRVINRNSGSLQRQGVLGYLDGSGATCDPATSTSPCFVIMSACQPNYDTTSQTSNQSSLCPAAPSFGGRTKALAFTTATGQQLGWVFDFPYNNDPLLTAFSTGTGERVFSDRPRLNGSNLLFTTVQPASNPCTGNTTGTEYDINYRTGGAPVAPVFVLPGNATGFILSTAFSGTGGAAIAMAPAGVRITGGAAQTPAQLGARPAGAALTSANQQCAGLAPAPTGSCIGAACPNFVPGWGFLMNQQGGTAAGSRCRLSVYGQESGAGLTPGWVYEPNTGRLSWKQIVR
jgi:hypothetical protein